MSFLDPYDVARATTPTPTQQQPTLDEEVNQVIGQLGSWWGGFRKQSQIALDTARKDLGSVVIQAQKELSKLTAAEEPDAAGPSTTSGSAAAVAEPGVEATDESTSADSSGAPTPRSGQPTSDGIQVGLLSRLQAAFPPSIVTTVRDHIPNSIRQASENIDVNQIRTNLLSELQRVQGLTLAQAEEYAHKSEEFLKEAVKEAGEVLRDAVKVIPPEDGVGGVAVSAPGLLWDGTDIWMLPSTSTAEGTEAESSSQAQGVSKARAAHTAVASRAEALLKRLKHDPEILRHDPGTEASAEFAKWKADEVDAVEGGLGSDAWKTKITAALDDPADGAGLKSVKDILVPSELTEEVFWLRFLFRSSQIRAEEEKRKALIQGSTDADEDFSWEDDDEDADEEEGNEEEEEEEEDEEDDEDDEDEDEDDDDEEEEEEAPKKPVVQSKPAAQPSLAPPGAGLRVGSSDSFDMVSSVTTSATSTAGDEKLPKVKGESDGDGDDSDWE